MPNHNCYFTRICLWACILFIATSCKDSDEFFNNNQGPAPTEDSANEFDFSTTRSIDLIVDYSSFETHGPVCFSIYASEPFDKSNLENPYWLKENVEPIFTDYTDENGKYDKTVTLPAYAKLLYVVTGDLYVSDRRMLAEVTNGTAKAIAENDDANVSARRAARRIKGAGEPTTDLTNLYNLWMEIDDKGNKTGKQIYKQWATPLGTWDSHSGRPNYLMEHTAANIAKGLVFSDAEQKGLFTTVKSALKSTSTCAEQYRTQSDLTLIRESEVSITMLGGNTCWCSTLGYYYYTEGTKPQTLQDMNIIMLFPNTMDEVYEDKTTCDMNGNVGVMDGDVVQLMYYPNIANGDFSGATTKFPKGTRIGFIMKTNGWGSQPGTTVTGQYGTEYTILKGTSGIGWDLSRKYNNWPSSTDGYSYSTALKDTGSKLIKNGNARTAKFGYVSPTGKEYPIVAFEDACNDENYSDVIFALNPAEAFDALPEVGANKSSTNSVWAFEDKWPRRGDYDMNDVIVNVKNELDFNSSGKVTKQTFYMTTYKNYVDLVTGLAVRLTNTSGTTARTRKVSPEGEVSNVTYESYTDNSNPVYYLTPNVEAEVGTTYVIELTYKTACAATSTAKLEPFVYRKETDDKQWELHIPFVAPTVRMNTEYFNTEDDKTNAAKGNYYVRSGLYPFAFYLSGAKVNTFLNTLLSSEGETFPINRWYPDFIPWSKSRGTTNEDWYLK